MDPLVPVLSFVMGGFKSRLNENSEYPIYSLQDPIAATDLPDPTGEQGCTAANFETM